MNTLAFKENLVAYVQYPPPHITAFPPLHKPIRHPDQLHNPILQFSSYLLR